MITGASAGVGLATARALAERGATVIAACRSQLKATPVLARLRAETGSDRIELLPLDLASLASVRDAAARFLDQGRPVDVLINNAGVAGIRGETRDGYELAFGVNHLGHFLLTALLWPRLVQSSGARVVHVSSRAHYDARKIRFDRLLRPTRTFTGLPEYQVSKLCNVLFSAELARRAGPSVHTYSLHPGVVASELWRRIPQPVRGWVTRRMITPEEGSATSLHCAASPHAADETGLYYHRCTPREPSPLAQDQELARVLWERSEGWSKTRFAPADAD